MPVTKTARRALRGSVRKLKVNSSVMTNLEIAIRKAKKSKNAGEIIKAISLTDRAVKKHIFHKNKAAHIKSTLSKLVKGNLTSGKAKADKQKKVTKKKSSKRTSKAVK